MDPSKKRKIRLVVALCAAVLLGVALVYTSFSASSEARQPSDLQHASGGNYQLTGIVVPGSIAHHGSRLSFQVADRDNPSAKIPVRYSGTIPDPFQKGREVIVSGTVKHGTFMGDRDSLITKCPSKFQDQATQDPDHVVIDDSAPS